MSRRKQTNPRAIKRDVSRDDDENDLNITKKLAVESTTFSNKIDPDVMKIEEQEQEQEHDEEKISTIQCDNCQESFPNSEQFNQHRLYECSFLTETTSDESRTSSSLDEFTQQIETIPYGTSQSEEYPHGCSYCQKSFSNMALLLKHEQVHVELMPFRCSFCGKGFKHRRSLNRHSKLHTGERKFKCTLCESTFARSDHLKAHIRTHSNNNHHPHHHHHHQSSPVLPVDKSIHVDFQLKIPFSSKTEFETRRISTETKSSKEDQRTEHCPLCPRICLGEESLRLHLQNEHHQNIDESLKTLDTYCFLCNAKFNNVENYLAHLRCTHPSIRPGKSSNSFPLSNKSIDEEKLFTEYALIEKTITCEKCQRAFDSMTMYLQHYSFQHCLQIIKCLQCQDVFETIESFFSHIEKNHPSKTVENFKCKLCNATYKHRPDFLHHLRTVHKLLSPSSPSSIESIDFSRTSPSFNALFSCKFCPMKLSSRFDLNHHILHEHDNERQENSKKIPSTDSFSSTFKCSYCQTSFTSRTQLDRHARIHIAASGTNLKCNICDRLFGTIDILSEHKLSHCKATTSNICSFCHEILENENDYSRHLFEHNQQTTNLTKNKTKLFSNHQETTTIALACIVCKQSLINEREIDLHAKFHLNKSIDTSNCHRCHLSTTNDRNFLIDLSTWTISCFQCLKPSNVVDTTEIEQSSKLFSCPKCRSDIQFDNLKTYQQHFASIHSNSSSNIDEFHCLKCNKIVSSREHVVEHLISTRCSSPVRVHYCYLCRTNFENAIKMHIHLIEHQYPNRDFQCEICQDKTFDDANQLYQHMVQHGSKARLYPCRECDVFFMFSMHLINHQYSHKDEPTFRSAFLQKTNENSVTRTTNDDELNCKTIVTRSSSKATNRSVTVN